MQKSQLIDVLKALRKIELREFERYLSNPFFNKEKILIDLYQHIKKCHPDFNQNKLDKLYVVKRILKEKEEQVGLRKLGYVMSRLKKQAENFIVWKEVQRQETDRYFLLLKAYQNRGVDKPFFKVIKQLEQQMKEVPKDIFYYQYLFNLSYSIYSHHVTQRIDTEVDGLTESINALDAFYFSAKLKFAGELANRENIVCGNREILLFDEVLRESQKEVFKDNLLLLKYKLSILLFNEFNCDLYHELKQLLINHLHYYAEEEQQDTLFFLINFCLNAHNSGKKGYLQETLNWYKFGLKNNLLIDEGHMDNIDFNNIVNVACSLQEFEWVHQFILKYTSYLEKGIRENARLLALAEVYISERKEACALDVLQEVVFNDDYDKLRVKSLQLKSFYELEGYEESMYSLLDAFVKFIQRNKRLSDWNKEGYIKFISFLKKIWENKEVVIITKEELVHQLASVSNIAFRTWLKQKIDELN